MRRRRLLTLLLAALIALGLATGSPTAAYAGDNAAISVNTKDGTTVFRVAFAIRHVMGDVVDETNGAVAYASCNDCAAVAIAFEIVLVEGSPSTVTPTNVAIAINENCDTCVAVAEAYQFVLGTGGLVHFDNDGNKILADIRKELHSLKKEDLTIDQLQAELDSIAARIADVLANHLVPVPGKKTGQQETTTATTESTTPTTPTPTPTPTTTTGPTTTTAPTTTEPVTTEPTTTEPTTTSGVTTTTGP
jgi:putative peptide zinc metalloprotease protein